VPSRVATVAGGKALILADSSITLIIEAGLEAGSVSPRMVYVSSSYPLRRRLHRRNLRNIEGVAEVGVEAGDHDPALVNAVFRGFFTERPASTASFCIHGLQGRG